MSAQKTNFVAPKGFDPANPAHVRKVLTQLATKMGDESTDDFPGGGWRITGYDPDARRIYAARTATFAETTHDTKRDEITVRLPIDAKPSNGDKYAAELEDDRPGYYMTSYEPFLHRATLTRLTDDEARCRGAISVALGVKPWDVQVKARSDGGFDLGLPKNYQPSKADKIQEVASEVIGKQGWYAKIDAQRLTASLIPADPPTFPPAIPTPLKRLGKGDVMSTPFGHILAAPGEADGKEAVIDWRASGSALVSGLAGGGKTVAITAIMADRISNGARLAVIDTADKSIDYLAFKDLCAVEGINGKLIPTWGCDSLAHSVAVLAMLCEEGKARAKYLAKQGINNWLDLPPGKGFDPIFIIADEYEALVAREPEPKALPKDHPVRVEAAEANMAHDLIAHYMNRIVKEFRFVGLNPLISTQVSNASTGLPPSLKGKMGHFVLCGSTPSEAARKQSFPDANAVPLVPENVASGGAVARGTGSAKIEGGGAFVFKSYFAPVPEYAKALHALGVKRFSEKQVVPTAAQINEYVPRLDDEGGESTGRGAGGGVELAPSGKPAAQVAREMGDTYGQALHDGSLGDNAFERANAARHAAKVGGGGDARTRKQKAEAAEEAEWGAQSSAVTVKRRTPDENNPFQSGE